MRKRLAGMILATAVAGCATPKKVSNPIPLVDIPAPAAGTYYSNTTDEKGKKHCFQAIDSNDLQVEDLGAPPENSFGRCGTFRNKQLILDWSEAMDFHLPPVTFVYENRIVGKIIGIEKDRIGLDIMFETRIDKTRTEERNGRSLTGMEEWTMEMLNAETRSESRHLFVLGDSVEIIERDNGETSRSSDGTDHFTSYLRRIGANSFCFQTTGNNRAYVEIY